MNTVSICWQEPSQDFTWNNVNPKFQTVEIEKIYKFVCPTRVNEHETQNEAGYPLWRYNKLTNSSSVPHNKPNEIVIL